MPTRPVILVTLFLVMPACGSSGKKDAVTQTPPNPADNSVCDSLDIAATPARTCGYQAVDANTVSAVCNEPNLVTTLHPDCFSDPSPSYCRNCNLNPNWSGTWVPRGVSAKRMTASFDCQGNGGYETVWRCQTQTMNIAFADDTNQTFEATESQEFDPNNRLRSMELDSCNPPTMDTSLPGKNGAIAGLSLQIPSVSFVPGMHPIQVSGGNDPNAIDIGVTYAGYGPGDVTDGSISFSATALDTNDRLAFNLDVTVMAPSGNTQQDIDIIYCGHTGDFYYGQWLAFSPSEQ